MTLNEKKVLTLPTNFRSLRGVIDSVGCAFNNPPLAGFYSEEEKKSARQFCSRTDSVGTTMVLPPYAPAETDDSGETNADQRSADELAADAAARLVRQLVDGRTPTLAENDPAGGSRYLTWGDILVLCRTRT